MKRAGMWVTLGMGLFFVLGREASAQSNAANAVPPQAIRALEAAPALSIHEAKSPSGTKSLSVLVTGNPLLPILDGAPTGNALAIGSQPEPPEGFNAVLQDPTGPAPTKNGVPINLSILHDPIFGSE